MPDIQQNIVVPYRPAEMYQLVNDVEKYSEFLPWCTESRILQQDADEVHAMLVLSGGGFQKSFTTCNRLQQNKMIEIRLVDGPFRHLEGFWRFETVAKNKCRVVLDLEFEFSNKLLALAFGPIFHQVVTTLIDAFHKRAIEVYGKRDKD